MRPVGEVSRQSLVTLLFSQGLCIAPLMFELPLWIAGLWAFTLIWRVQIFRGALAFPSRFLKTVVAVLALIGLYFSPIGAFSVESFVSFLLISYCLKLLEVRDRNDAVLLVNVGFMALTSYFLFSQTLWAGLYFVFASIFLLQAWMGLFRERLVPWRTRWFTAATVFLQAFPLLVVLFIAMPRLGQLWQLPTQTAKGKSGFSDSMSPGSMSELIQSNEVAFRVSFEDDSLEDPLPPSKRYWRGLVLENFDGRTWKREGKSFRERASRSKRPLESWQLEYDKSKKTLAYTVLLEPHYKKWLFSLPVPVSASSSSMNISFSSDVALYNRSDVISRSQYTVRSSFDYQLSPKHLDESVKNLNLKLPTEGNTKTRALVQSWLNEFGGEDGWQLKVIEQYQELVNQSFNYTLRPPALSGNVIDEFLFDTQKGFCEHFSSSFVFAMRSAGIPARVVVGYQGGEYNKGREYMIVRQRDAHAWAEVWIEGIGWRRVDPTAAVAPNRIESGISGAVSEEDSDLVGGYLKDNFMYKSLRWMQLRVDSASFNWHRWVLSYDDSSKDSFFERWLGGSDAWRIAVFFIVGGGLSVFIYLLASGLLKRKVYQYSESELYAKHLRLLAKAGYEKAPGESPIQFAERVGLENTLLADALKHIATLYADIAFSNKQELLTEFAEVSQKFKI